MRAPVNLAPRHHKILAFLTRRNPSKLTSAEIYAEVGGNLSLLYNDLRFLVANGYLSRERSGRMNELLFSLGSKRQAVSNEIVRPLDITSDILLKWLQSFAETDTYTIRPQYFGWKIPWAVGKLYEQLVRQLHGEKVSQIELDNAREGIRELYNALVAMLSTVKGLLASEDLWEPTKMQPLLLGDAPAELVVSLSVAINEKWSKER